MSYAPIYTQEVTNAPYVVVTANLKTKNPISWSKWSYYFTIYTPHDSLDYHITWNLSYKS